ncbi:MAG TPA: YkvA family protein [Longimicrobiales bacterium]|nr:YkvA family protein [Longimicrobiales bacterium]
MARKLGYRFGRARVRQAVGSLLRQAPAVLRLFGRLMTDVRVSTVDRALVGAVIAYVISPWDLVPDFLLIIGVVDDLFLIGIALDRLLMRAPAEAVEEHWEGTSEGLETLTAELQAIGEALPNALRSILHGRVGEGAWGQGLDAEVYEADDGLDTTWAPAERARRRGPVRPTGREVAPRDLDDEPFDDDPGGEGRVGRYRSRL